MNDSYFMRIAIEQARQGDWPYGAVVVKDHKVIAQAFNTTTRDRDSTAHAEVNVIRKALKFIPEASLHGYTLYTTGEPCAMCAGAAIWAGFSRIVYAASIRQLMGAGHPQINTTALSIIETGFIPLEVQAGVLADEVLEMIASRGI
ncbi:MAG: nucleoside deaminase [Methylococcales bacterium]